jgi:3-hydroxybutyryl-CoA dehydrogenase
MRGDMSDAMVVIGGGTMGAGIAQVFVQAGFAVYLIEAAPLAADAARLRVADGLGRAHRQEPDPAARVASDLTRLTVLVGRPPGLQPDLVIEAVPEVPELKASILGPASRAWPDAVIATNTSSLSVDGLARSVERPSRFVGMHFFNPVPRSVLVEIVVGAETDAATVGLARSWVASVGKDCIEVRDAPGFATSRLGVALGLEAIRMVEEGVASVEDIDKGMRLGYRFPMGPLELTDLVGLDVRLAIAEHLAAELGARFDPPALLREKVGRGEMGRKSGRGFYDWDRQNA